MFKNLVKNILNFQELSRELVCSVWSGLFCAEQLENTDSVDFKHEEILHQSTQVSDRISDQFTQVSDLKSDQSSQVSDRKSDQSTQQNLIKPEAKNTNEKKDIKKNITETSSKSKSKTRKQKWKEKMAKNTNKKKDIKKNITETSSKSNPNTKKQKWKEKMKRKKKLEEQRLTKFINQQVQKTLMEQKEQEAGAFHFSLPSNKDGKCQFHQAKSPSIAKRENPIPNNFKKNKFKQNKSNKKKNSNNKSLLGQ